MPDYGMDSSRSRVTGLRLFAPMCGIGLTVEALGELLGNGLTTKFARKGIERPGIAH